MQLQSLCSLRLNIEEDLLEELGRLPQDLADTYAQIFEHVRRLGPQSRIIAERSLNWLLCQARELSESEFLAAVSMGPKRESVNLTKEKVLFICGNLVMFDQELKVFRFAHLSVREYLETQSEFTLGAAHALGAEMSLLVCLHRYTEFAAKHARKFRRYAILYWLYHCQEAKKSSLGGSLHQLLEDFLLIREGTSLAYDAWVRSVHRLRRTGDSESDDGRMESDDNESDNWSVEAVADELDNWAMDSDNHWLDSTNDDLSYGTLKERRPSSGARESGPRSAERDQEEDMILDSILGARHYQNDPTFAACCLGLPEIVEQNLQSVLSSVPKNMEKASRDRGVFKPQNLRQQTYLHVSCHSGSFKLLRLLLQWRLFPVRSKDSCGRTALHYAVNPHDVFLLKRAKWTAPIRVAHDQAMAAERVAMIGLLTENGSIIDAFDGNGETALHLASSANLVAEAQVLLRHGALVDPRNNRGSTPLLLATKSGHTAVVRLLLEFEADTESKHFDYKTPLLLAAQSGHTAVVQLLLQSKAVIEAKDLNGMTPLLLATQSGHTTVAQLLLQSRADVEARNKYGETPLLQAVESGHTAIAQLLLQCQADIEARDRHEETPVFKAVTKRKVDTVRFFLQLGADINAKDLLGEAPLARSIRISDEPMAQMLIEEGASIRELDRHGNTALHYAAGSRLGAVVSRLLEMGLYIDATNIHGSTPLHVAIKPQFPISANEGEYFHIVQLLVDAGADVEMSDDGGRTPLHLAAQEADKASVQILLNRGANIKAEDSEGLLPLDHAADSNSLEVFSLLFKRWADVMAESSKDAVESWLRLATKTARAVGDDVLWSWRSDVLRSWRSLSFEDLIDLTSDCEVQKYWTSCQIQIDFPTIFSEDFWSWFEARQVRKKSQ